MPVLRPFRAIRYAGSGSVEFTPGEHGEPRFDSALLREDPEAALYFYRQKFRFPGDDYDSIRDSVIGLLDRTNAVIHTHEEIFPERAYACRRSLDENGLQSSPLFLWVNGASPLRVDDMPDDDHIWALTDPATIARVQTALRGKSLFLADGHHRFAAGWQMAAIHFRGDPPRTHALRTLASHRLVLDARHVQLPPLIEIEDAQEFWNTAPPGVLRFAVILPGPKLFGFEMPSAIASRALTVLHRDVLHDAPVRPVRGTESAFEAVRNGSAQMAFLVQPLTVDQIEEDAKRAILLPPKSTDFFPKVAGGLVMHRRQNESVKPPVAQMPGVRYASS